jgi:hypothetical protein
MGETAEERARRLALERALDCFNLFDNCVINGRYGSTIDVYDYERMLDDTCREMIDEVRDKPTVSLVKKYSKGTFKFVNEMKKVEREKYDLIINFFQ